MGAPRLRCPKLDRAVFRFCPDGLPFTKFSLENVHAQGIEQVALDRAFQRPRAVNRIITFAGNERFRRVSQLQRDILLGQTFR